MIDGVGVNGVRARGGRGGEGCLWMRADRDDAPRRVSRRGALRMAGLVGLGGLTAAAGVSGIAGCSNDTLFGWGSGGRGSGEASLIPSRALRISYGRDRRQFGDLFLPRDSTPVLPEYPVPVAVMIHGGGWSTFSRAASTAHMAADLAERGMAVWNIEYRGVGGGGGWPNTYLDVAAAIDFLPRMANDLPVTLDLDRVTVAGVSAGGNLAAWAVSRSVLPKGTPGSDPGFPVRSCVAMAGVYDMMRAWAAGDKYVAGLLGGTPREVPDHYRKASPAAHIAPDARMVLFHGRDDSVVSVRQVEYFSKAAEKAGNPVEAHVFGEANHGVWGDVKSTRWESVRREIVAQLGS